MFKFFANQKQDNAFILSLEVLKHIKISRIENEKFIIVYQKNFYICKLENKMAIILKELKENHEFEEEVIIAAAIINIKRFEWLIQKAVELGATIFIPIISKNISIKINDNILQKIKRWNKIILNASKQSFRNCFMKIYPLTNFDDVMKINVKNKYIAYTKFQSIVKKSFKQNSLFLIGPEGGFTKKEIIKANKNNFETISLGKRILRTETAAIFVLSRVN